MHSTGTNTRKISSLSAKNGDLFQRIHGGAHRTNKNAEADNLAKAAAHNTPIPTDVFFQMIKDASVKRVLQEPKLINIIEGEDWRAPIMAYLRHYYEPDNRNEEINQNVATCKRLSDS
jgi:hypothetical protein